MPTNQEFLTLLLSQDGDRYIFGAEASPSDSNPDAFDCSELIEWACARLSVSPRMPDGTWNQVTHCRNKDTLVKISKAIETPGALLFSFSGGDPFGGHRPAAAHVAVSQGNGKTIEARSTRHGVGQFSVLNRGWTHAGLVPGMTYDQEEVIVYKNVDNVPEKEWAENVIDDGINAGAIKNDDKHPDDWDRPVTYGDLWTTLDRLGWPKAGSNVVDTSGFATQSELQSLGKAVTDHIKQKQSGPHT